MLNFPALSWRSFLLLCAGLLGLLMWFSSGTLAPYAATLPEPLPLPPCNYLANIDHAHFLATYEMIDGRPWGTWAWSVVLRRLLYPLLAYPWMRRMGYEFGGFAFNWLLHIGALLLFARHARRRWNENTARWVTLLLATYPGIFYWVGLPYSYAAIVPSCLALYAIAAALEQKPGVLKMHLLFLAAGVLCTAYDFLPNFGVAFLALLAWQKRWRWLPSTFALLIAPTVAVAMLLKHGMGVPLTNSNSGIYGVVIGSYLHPGDFSAWLALLLQIPKLFLLNFFDSQFTFLSLLFAACLFWAWRWRQKSPLSVFDRIFLLLHLGLFLFLNAAPPYTGWPMRGEWISRLYQPLFVVVLCAAPRFLAQLKDQAQGKLVQIALICTVLANVVTALWPLSNFPQFWSWPYRRFYIHNPRPLDFGKNLDHFGRRPYGFCDSSNATKPENANAIGTYK